MWLTAYKYEALRSDVHARRLCGPWRARRGFVGRRVRAARLSGKRPARGGFVGDLI